MSANVADENVCYCVFQTLVREPERPVQMSVAQLVAALAKHEFKGSGSGCQWPQLLDFLRSHLSSGDHGQRLLGMYLLSVLCDVIGEQARPLVRLFAKSLGRALGDDQLDIGFYAVRAMTSMVPHVGSDDLGLFQPLVAPVVQLVAKLVQTDETKAAEAMEIFDELFESEVTIVVPHIRAIVDLALNVAASTALDNALRVKAIALLGRLTRLKKKAIVKQKLYVQIIDVLFPIIATIEEDNMEESEAADSGSPAICACQVRTMLTTLSLPFYYKNVCLL
jgi:hypothetical protein